MPHMKRLYGAAYRLTGDAADAEDLVQETLLRAYRRFHLFVPGSNVKAWLLTILRNTERNRRRDAARAIVVVDNQAVDDSEMRDAASTESLETRRTSSRSCLDASITTSRSIGLKPRSVTRTW